MVCAYCSSNEKTTKDHVPPKSIIPKKNRSTIKCNFIKVPCCLNCNQHFSKGIDENFKIYLGFLIGALPDAKNPLLREYFNEMLITLNTGKQNLKKELIQNLIRLKNGQSAIVLPNNSRIILKQMGERLIKGLYYFKYRKRIDLNSKLKFQIYDFLKIDKLNIFHEVCVNPFSLNIDKNLFLAEYAIIEDIPNSVGSIWKFTFYEKYELHAIVHDSHTIGRITK